LESGVAVAEYQIPAEFNLIRCRSVVVRGIELRALLAQHCDAVDAVDDLFVARTSTSARTHSSAGKVGALDLTRRDDRLLNLARERIANSFDSEPPSGADAR